MTDCKLVPVEPTPEMVSAAEDAYMPFGDMELALRMAILAAPDVKGEPVGFVNPKLMRHLGVSHDGVVMGSKADSDRTMPLYTAPQPAEQQPDPTDAQILAITTAYEQGVGKGHDAHHRGEEIQNPYGTSWGCDKAWHMGYEEGKKQAANGAKSSAVKPRPAPGVQTLVEALERSVAGFDALSGMASLDAGARNYARQKALELNANLAAHRKGGGGE